jgi:hypothetical protein
MNLLENKRIIKILDRPDYEKLFTIVDEKCMDDNSINRKKKMIIANLLEKEKSENMQDIKKSIPSENVESENIQNIKEFILSKDTNKMKIIKAFSNKNILEKLDKGIIMVLSNKEVLNKIG